MNNSTSVDFFDQQFQRQIGESDFALNPFERAAIPFLRGRVLDFGCGLGNLALHAARQGHSVVALDASATAIAHLQQVAREQALPLSARQTDLRQTQLDERFDTVLCIGLLMFFDCDTARHQLDHLQSLVSPGGALVLNVLTAETTFMGMFSAEGHCLFQADELPGRFAGWDLLLHERSRFPAPQETIKAFVTLVARKPV